jgi:hypothetical protein
MFEDMIERDDSSLSGCVGHYESSTQYTPSATASGKYKKFYETYPVTFVRPTTGEKRATDACRICGEKLEFKIRSKPAVTLLKIKLRVAGFAGVALGIALLSAGLPTGQLSAGQAFRVLVFLFSLFGGLGALAYSVFPKFELALKMKAKGKTEHKLFETVEDKLAYPGLSK